MAANIQFPSILEEDVPVASSAGRQRLFLDQSEGLLKLKDSTGTVTTVGGDHINQIVVLRATSGDGKYGSIEVPGSYITQTVIVLGRDDQSSEVTPEAGFEINGTGSASIVGPKQAMVLRPSTVNGWAMVSTGAPLEVVANLSADDLTTDLTTGAARTSVVFGQNVRVENIIVTGYSPSGGAETSVSVDYGDSSGLVPYSTVPISVDSGDRSSISATTPWGAAAWTLYAGTYLVFDVDTTGATYRGVRVHVLVWPV